MPTPLDAPLGPFGRKQRRFGAALDRVLPARRLRIRFRRWRRTRPFWGGLLAGIGGIALIVGPLPLLALAGVMAGGGLIGSAVAVFSGIALGLMLMATCLFCWFMPSQRWAMGVVALIAAVLAFPLSNFGGLFVGSLCGILGGSMTLAWSAYEKPRLGRPPATRSRRVSGVRERGVRAAALLPVVLAFAAAPGQPGRAAAQGPEASGPCEVPAVTVMSGGGRFDLPVATATGVRFCGFVELPQPDGTAVRVLQLSAERLQTSGLTVASQQDGAPSAHARLDVVAGGGQVFLQRGCLTDVGISGITVPIDLFGDGVCFGPDFPPEALDRVLGVLKNVRIPAISFGAKGTVKLVRVESVDRLANLRVCFGDGCLAAAP